MATKLSQRVYRLRQRKTDLTKGLILNSRRLSEARTFDSAMEAVDYIAESMVEMDSAYTKLTYEQANRVRDQLQEACNTNYHPVEFRYQGSVTNNTHIKFYSDIDLLMLTDRFFSVQPPVQVDTPYQWDPLSDLKKLRKIAVDRLSSSFYAATVDATGNKAVSISGGSLQRKIDVVFGSWLDTQKYRLSTNEQDRGVKILDLSGPSRIPNFPFAHNRELENKDKATNGNLKRLIRFLKSAKSDADDEIKVSSYDLASLAHAIPFEDFVRATGSDISLIERFLIVSDKLCTDQQLRQSVYVPNKTRLIFCEEGANVDQVKLLNEEIASILIQAKTASASLSRGSLW